MSKKSFRRVLSVFLCMLLIFTQLISGAFALEKNDAMPLESDIQDSVEGREAVSGVEEPGEAEPGKDESKSEAITDREEGEGLTKTEEPQAPGEGENIDEGREPEDIGNEETGQEEEPGNRGDTYEPDTPENPDESEVPDEDEKAKIPDEGDEAGGDGETGKEEEFDDNKESDYNRIELNTTDDNLTTADKVYTYVYTDHIDWYLENKNAKEYQITDAKELTGLAELVNGTAKDAEDKLIGAVDFSGKRITLTDDIDLSKVCYPAGGVSWQPIGTSSTQFKGVFDGNSRTISGLYINSDKTHLGLFGYINDAEIRNLTVEGSIEYTGTSWSSYVSGIAAYVAGTCQLEDLTSSVALVNPSDHTGGIAAYMSGASKISHCINHGDIYSGDSYTGGILGYGSSSSAIISDCYVKADIKGAYSIGAIVGSFNTSATLENCFYYNPGEGMTIAGSGKPSNCYYLSDTPIEDAKGIAKSEESFRYGEVTYLLNGRSAHRSDWAQGKDHPVFGDASTKPLYRISLAPHIQDSAIEFDFIDLDESLHPILEKTGGKSLYVPNGTEISLKFKGLTFFMPEGICIPDETEEGVYHIIVNGEDITVTYGTEEELIQPTLSWYSQNEVTYVINMEPELRGLALLTNGGYPELKEDFKGKTVMLGKDIKLIGEWEPIGKNKDWSFKGTFDGSGHSISGLKIGSDAENGAADGNYQGLFGYTEGTLKNLTVTGSVYGRGDYVGGIVGYSAGSIDKCTFGENGGSAGYVSGKNYVGGIAGSLDGYYSGPVTSSSNSGTVVGEEYVGGIVGYASNTSADRIKDNLNKGRISGEKDVGGIVGHAMGGISGNKNSGSVQGIAETGSNIGGIVGFSNRTYEGYLIQNTNIGQVTSEGENVGGIAGYARGPISEGINSGNITGKSNVGGIVGNLERATDVLNSYSAGRVTAAGEDGKCGSLVGNGIKGSAVKNSYSYNPESFNLPFSGSEDTTVADSYFLVPDGYDGDDPAAKTKAQFENGEVAWLLDGGEKTREATAWTQEDVAGYPVLGEEPIFRVKIREEIPVEGCSLTMGQGGLTESITYTETNPENPDEKWDWKCAYVRSGKEIHFLTEIKGNYEVIFTPPLELKKVENGCALNVKGNYTGSYTFGVIVPPDYSWYSNPEANEFTLSTEAHLVALGELVNGTAVIEGLQIPAVDFAGKVINLDADIDLKTGNWKAIGNMKIGETAEENTENPFKGTFDGKNHGIDGLNIKATTDNQGLFGYVKDAAVKDLAVRGEVYSTGKNTGGIVGFASGTCRFENLSFGSDTTVGSGDSKLPGESEEPDKGNSEEPDAGGSDESNESEPGEGEENSGQPVKLSNVNGAAATGGILGTGMFSENSSEESITFINCINHGPILGAGTETGGIVGYIYHASNNKAAKAVIKECKNHGTVEGTAKYTAGIVARIGSGTSQSIISQITDSSNDGSVSGKDQYTAGVAGYAVSSKISDGRSSISGCGNNGTVTGNGQYMGGIAAYILNYAKVSDCGNTGTVKNDGVSYSAHTGGIIGNLQSWSDDITVMQSCYNRGNITGNGNYIGGIAGYSESNTSIRDCNNEGEVIGGDYTGGITGSFAGDKLERCYNLADIQGAGRTGGVTGSFKGEKPLSICFNDGDIKGTDLVGGIVGKVEESGRNIVTSCYNTGNISGTGSGAKAGGITGENHFSSSGGGWDGSPVVRKPASGVSYCYNHGEILASKGEAGAVTAGYYQMNNNCFYKEDSISKPADSDNAKSVDGAELASGKIAWIMNGGKGKRIDGWSQREGFPVIAGPGDGPAYRISVRSSQNGEVADSSLAQELYANTGDTVELSITPAEGCLLKLLTVDGYNSGKNHLSISNTEKIKFDMPSEDVIITPIFGLWGLEDEYTVTFMVDGGVYEKPQVVKNGGTVTEPDAPVKEGYSFDGWYTAETGGQKWNFATAVTEDVTLYVHWRIAGMMEVTFDANGGHFSDGSETTVVTMKSDEKITFPEDPKRSDTTEEGDIYRFEGWYTDRIGENKIDKTYTVIEDMTCYAKWEEVDKFSLGTEEDPFIIESPEMLRELASRVNKGNDYEGCWFKLAKNVDWTLTDWTPIGAIGEFCGNFNGNGQIIKLTGSSGLFGTLRKVKIYNFTLIADIEGGDFTGAVAGAVSGSSNRDDSGFKDITVKGEVSGNNKVGGFVGQIDANASRWVGYYDVIVSFENCHNKATVTGSGERVGGFAGSHSSYSVYKNCSNSGKIIGEEGVGGLTGYAPLAIIEDTYNSGEIVGNGENVAGLVGGMGFYVSAEKNSSIEISRSYNTGNVSGDSYVGGLLGGSFQLYYGGTDTGWGMYFTECNNTGNITGSGYYVGGIAGEINPSENAVFENCNNNGEISGYNNYIAGIFGGASQGSTTVKNCHNEGKIIGNDYAAGIFGRSGSRGTAVEDCYNLGGVKGAKYTAGIFGYSNSEATTVKDCYNRGDISGSEYAAGIYGSIIEGSESNETAAIYCYSSGKITGTGGAIAGGNFEKNSNCYYIAGNITAPADAEYAAAKTAEDFLLGEVAYLLDGGGGERRDKWTQDKEAGLPKRGTPSYYKVELESNQSGTIDVDGHVKAFAPSGQVIKIYVTEQDSHDDGEVKQKCTLDLLTVRFGDDGDDIDITAVKSFTMQSSDAKVTATFKSQEVKPEEPSVPKPEPGDPDNDSGGRDKGEDKGTEGDVDEDKSEGVGAGEGTGEGQGTGQGADAGRQKETQEDQDRPGSEAGSPETKTVTDMPHENRMQIKRELPTVAEKEDVEEETPPEEEPEDIDLKDEDVDAKEEDEEPEEESSTVFKTFQDRIKENPAAVIAVVLVILLINAVIAFIRFKKLKK